MAHFDTFTRQRAPRVPDPYNPDATVEDWDNPVEISLEGFFDASFGTEQTDALRSQAVTFKVLALTNTQADVSRGDRIKQGEKVWTVEGFPDAPRNPFTGKRPYLYLRLKEAVG